MSFEEQTEPTTLAEGLPREMARVRDKVLPQYIAMRGMPQINVEPAIFMMRAALDAAAKAMMDSDVVAMLRAYQSLKETKE